MSVIDDRIQAGATFRAIEFRELWNINGFNLDKVVKRPRSLTHFAVTFWQKEFDFFLVDPYVIYVRLKLGFIELIQRCFDMAYLSSRELVDYWDCSRIKETPTNGFTIKVVCKVEEIDTFIDIFVNRKCQFTIRRDSYHCPYNETINLKEVNGNEFEIWASHHFSECLHSMMDTFMKI